jgi:hypothetical protein
MVIDDAVSKMPELMVAVNDCGIGPETLTEMVAGSKEKSKADEPTFRTVADIV